MRNDGNQEAGHNVNRPYKRRNAGSSCKREVDSIGHCKRDFCYGLYRLSKFSIHVNFSIKCKKLESVAIANALQLEGRPTYCQSFWAVFGQLCTAHAHKLLITSIRSEF